MTEFKQIFEYFLGESFRFRAVDFGADTGVAIILTNPKKEIDEQDSQIIIPPTKIIEFIEWLQNTSGQHIVLPRRSRFTTQRAKHQAHS